MPVSIAGPKFYVFDSNGDPVEGAKINTYEIDGVTRKETFNGEDGAANSNPVLTNAAGYADVYLDGVYAIVVTDADDNLIWSENPITSGNQLAQAWVNKRTAAFASTTSITIVGNCTSIFMPGRRIKIQDSADLYGTIVTSSYSSPNTTVTVSVDGSTALSASVEYAWVFFLDRGDIMDKVKNVASLRGITGDSGYGYIHLQSHTTSGDGGQGEFRWVSGASAGTYVDNNGTIIVPTGGDGSAAWLRVYTGAVNVRWFGATGNGTTDDTVAIQAAIDSLSTTGGRVYLTRGRYKVTSTIRLGVGIEFYGDGRGRPNSTAEYIGVSSLYAAHTGAAVLSLKGRNHCRLRGIALESDTTTFPKTALLLGRDSASSAGNHYIEHIMIRGNYSAAAIYSIASEENTFVSPYVWMYANGGAKHVFYTSTADDLSVDSLVTSTNVWGTFITPYFINSSFDADSACIYLASEESMGSWNFFGGYLIPNRGAYIHIHNAADSTTLGPYNFVGVSGERLGDAGDPTYGVLITSSVAWTLRGLNISGSRFNLLSNDTPDPGDLRYTIWIDSNITLSCPNVVLQPAEAFSSLSGYALTVYNKDKIQGGIFTVGRYANWATATLAGAWVNSFGAPYAPAGYCLDQLGCVRLRGSVSAGTGTIMTLPEGYRPKYNMFFPVYANAAMGRVLITTAGVVSLSVGSAPVDLNAIQFYPG